MNDHSLWEFAAAVDGWNQAQAGEEQVDPLTYDEFEDLIDRHQDWIVSSGTATRQ